MATVRVFFVCVYVGSKYGTRHIILFASRLGCIISNNPYARWAPVERDQKPSTGNARVVFFGAKIWNFEGKFINSGQIFGIWQVGSHRVKIGFVLYKTLNVEMIRFNMLCLVRTLE